jgi:hypothetical protein
VFTTFNRTKIILEKNRERIEKYITGIVGLLMKTNYVPDILTGSSLVLHFLSPKEILKKFVNIL